MAPGSRRIHVSRSISKRPRVSGVATKRLTPKGRFARKLLLADFAADRLLCILPAGGGCLGKQNRKSAAFADLRGQLNIAFVIASDSPGY
jgi:hypothetical protein